MYIFVGKKMAIFRVTRQLLCLHFMQNLPLLIFATCYRFKISFFLTPNLPTYNLIYLPLVAQKLMLHANFSNLKVSDFDGLKVMLTKCTRNTFMIKIIMFRLLQMFKQHSSSHTSYHVTRMNYLCLVDSCSIRSQVQYHYLHEIYLCKQNKGLNRLRISFW